MEMKNLLKTVEGILAGDGNAYDRMNAVKDGIGLPSIIYKIVDYCKANNIDYLGLERASKSDKGLQALLNEFLESN